MTYRFYILVGGAYFRPISRGQQHYSPLRAHFGPGQLDYPPPVACKSFSDPTTPVAEKVRKTNENRRPVLQVL